MGERMLLTLAVAGGAVVFTWMLAVPIGIYSAVRQYSAGDHLFTLFGFLGLAVPNFLLALVFMYIAIIWLDQSVGGLFSPDYLSASWSLGRVWDMLKHLWIPAIVLGTAGTAGLIRIMRANLLDELRKPYVVTARAKGLSERGDDPEIPGTGRAQSSGKRRRFSHTGPVLGCDNRVHSLEPAYLGTTPAGGSKEPGHVSVRHHCPVHRRVDRPGHAHIRFAPGDH